MRNTQTHTLLCSRVLVLPRKGDVLKISNLKRGRSSAEKWRMTKRRSLGESREALKMSKLIVTKNTITQISEWKKNGNRDNNSDSNGDDNGIIIAIIKAIIKAIIIAIK